MTRNETSVISFVERYDTNRCVSPQVVRNIPPQIKMPRERQKGKNMFRYSTNSNIFLFITFLYLSIISPIFAITNYDHFPTSFDGDSLLNADNNFAHWNKSKIALSGKITRIERGYVDKPYFQILLLEQNPRKLHIWIASLITSEIRIGQEVRVLGYFSEVGKDTLAVKYNKDKYHVLGFCIANITKKGASYLPDAKDECFDWQDGKLPQQNESH